MANALTTVTNPLVPTNMEGAIRLAELMSRGKVGIPPHLRGNPGDCLMVVEQAMRWRMSPYAVANCTSIIHDKLMFEGKLIAAAVMSSGELATRFRYDYSGEGDDRAVVASATLAGENEPRSIKVVLKDVRTRDKQGNVNRQWTGGQVDQQLSYYAVRAWSRRYAPGPLLGVYGSDEFSDTPEPETFDGTTIEAKAEPVTEQPKPRRTWADLIGEIKAKLDGCMSENEVIGVGASADVARVFDRASTQVIDELTALMNDAFARVKAPDEAAHDPDGVVEDHVPED